LRRFGRLRSSSFHSATQPLFLNERRPLGKLQKSTPDRALPADTPDTFEHPIGRGNKKGDFSFDATELPELAD